MFILALDQAGTPRRWIKPEAAIIYKAKDLIAWSVGDNIATFHGGVRRIDGERSVLSVPPIIAIKGDGLSLEKRGRVVLTNKTLFARDLHTCAYCGREYGEGSLSRDHIIPRSKGGKDIWENVVTACKRCNAAKDNLSLVEYGKELLYLPYAPNHFEEMILQNRRILASQMEFLRAGVPKHSRILLD